MTDKSSREILFELEKGYDSIADKFSSTRTFMWRDLEFIKNYTKSDDLILDFGCGNGRLAGYLRGQYSKYIGVDISQKLINIAKQKYSSEKTKFVKLSSDFKSLPFEDDYFDVVFSIAVFHHFPDKGYSLDIAKELYRVLKPGGKVIIAVWNLWQKQYLKYHKMSNRKWVDAEIPFRSERKIFKRYHHPFKLGELENLLRSAGFETVETKSGRNLLYVGGKLNNLTAVCQ